MSETTRYAIWTLVRQARRLAGVSQRELARRAGTSQPAIARYETGRVVPDLETLLRVVRVCGFDLRMELVPHDDHDELLIAENLQRTPAQRAAGNRRATRAMASAARSRVKGQQLVDA